MKAHIFSHFVFFNRIIRFNYILLICLQQAKLPQQNSVCSDGTLNLGTICTYYVHKLNGNTVWCNSESSSWKTSKSKVILHVPLEYSPTAHVKLPLILSKTEMERTSNKIIQTRIFRSACIVLQALLLIWFVNSVEKTLSGRKIVCFNKFREKSTSWRDIFELHFRTNREVACYPFSLNRYFKDLDKNGVTDKYKSMKYEWIRLKSFSTFPVKSPASGLLLAKSGFYYTGNGEEAVCYCCGLKNGLWNTAETVQEIHKRLSPNCGLVKGEDTSNVPIHEAPLTTHNFNNLSVGGATGGPEDKASENFSQAKREQAATETQTYPENQGSEVLSGKNQFLELQQETLPQSKQASLRSTEACRIGGNNDRFPGIVNDRPKHPEYATKTARLSSFNGWPASNNVQPVELVEAGFFYAGILDCVRCFFCGGGMKHWEYGDRPWTEHARWFPNCAFVKQFKGLAFIEMCRSLDGDRDPGQAALEQNIEAANRTGIEDLQIQDLNSTAVVQMFDMGYTQNQIEDAIKHARRRHSSGELRPDFLLEYLLDNNDVLEKQQSAIKPTKTKTNLAKNETKNEQKPSNKTEKEEKENLSEENQQLREQMMCKICMDKDANIVFLPCGHLVACVECAKKMRCLQKINSRNSAHLSVLTQKKVK